MVSFWRCFFGGMVAYADMPKGEHLGGKGWVYGGRKFGTRSRKKFILLYRGHAYHGQLSGRWVRQESGQKKDRNPSKKLKLQPGFP